MFVDAEDFLHDEERGKVAALRGHGAIRRYFTIRDRNLHFASDQPG